MEAFEKWYEEHGKEFSESSKKDLKNVYLEAATSLLATMSGWLHDRLLKSDEDDVMQEGAPLESYFQNAIDRLAVIYADEILKEPFRDALENHRELAMKQINVILESYSGKKLSGPDDDDGIEGEEAQARHLVFDGSLSALSSVKNGILKKDALVKTFRALADFYEKEV